MATTTLLNLDQRLLEAMGDWIQHPVTTALAASTTLVSTHFQKYRSTADYFNSRWVYMEDQVNIGVEKKVSDDDGTSTLSVLTNWTANTTGTNETFRISRYSWANRKLALNRAIEEALPNIHEPLDNMELIAGNWLPPFRWTSSSALDLWTANTTIAKTTTAGYVRGGETSCLITAGAADQYVSISSDNYPRLLDLMDETIDFKCWARASSADDAYLTIYTVNKAGSTQTLNSTTTCVADKWTLLELEDQTLNDDLVSIEFRLRVHTNTKTVYFSMPRVNGKSIYEYMLPYDFDNAHGQIRQVYVQTSGSADDWPDDLFPPTWERIYSYSLTSDGSYKYLRLPDNYASPRLIRLIGDKPFAALTSGSDTIKLDGYRLNTLVEYAAFKLFEIESGVSSSSARDDLLNKAMYHRSRYEELKRRQSMVTSSMTMKLPAL